MRVCKWCFFFFFSHQAHCSRALIISRRTNRKKIPIVRFSDHSFFFKIPFSSLPPFLSFFFSEVQRDTSCARLAARDYHTICISSSLPLDYYFPVIPANSRPLDRDREREKQEKKRNVKFSLSRPRSSSNTFRTRVSQILLYRRRRYIYIRFYLTER